MFEVAYVAKFVDGPLDGVEKPYVATNGILMDKIGEPFPTAHGFSCAEYKREGVPDQSGRVLYRWQDYDRVEILLTRDERAAIRSQLDGQVLNHQGTALIRSILERLVCNIVD
jgi:hypothetical protein